VYRVGNMHFYSKMEAIEMHAKTGIHPHWDFNESVYSNYDWSKEPTETLSELYKQRAQQIRNKYDYVVLWYSSGADSDNILRSFLDNNIHLDEAVSFYNFEATGNRNDFFNGEIFNVAAPLIQQYKEKYPHLKYRVIDVCNTQIEQFNRSDWKFDWIYNMNAIFNPNAVARNYLRDSVTEWQDMINSGKKVGFVWGMDKPRLHLIDGKYALRFVDLIDCAVNPDQQRKNKPGHYDELFYWSPDFPKIPIKQAHVIMNYLKNSNKTSPWMTTENSGLGWIENQGKKFYISSTGVNSLIYPRYEFRLANETKPPSVLWTPRDIWFYNLKESDVGSQVWHAGIEKLWQMVPDYWKNNPDDMLKGFKLCLSKPYFLENVN
jgi:hypothetical protein